MSLGRVLCVMAAVVASHRGLSGNSQSDDLLVFVDTSGSISDTAFKNTINLLNTLVYGWRGHVSIYPIDINAGSANPTYEGPGLSHRKHDLNLVRNYAAARGRLDQKHQRSMGSTVPESCIINSLALLGQKARGHAGIVRVVYISDMLEECKDTPAGRIVLQRVDTTHPSPRLSLAEQQSQFEAANRAIAKMSPKPGYLKNCELTLIIPGDVQESALEDLRKFWGSVLDKFGYPAVAQLEIQRNNIPPEINLNP